MILEAIVALLILNLVFEWRNHMDINEVQAKLTNLQTSVDALIALPSNPPPVDLQPLGDAIDGIQASVDAKLTAPVA